MVRQVSPFLNPGLVAKPNQLAIIQLSKDDLVPVYLRDTEGEHDGYKEGHVLNTRFGSFPHSTLIGAPWGSQVRASNVDTGSRGRKKKNKQAKEAVIDDKESGSTEKDVTGLKRKRDPNDEGEKRVKGAPDQPAAAIKDNTAEQAQETTVIGDTGDDAENEQKQAVQQSESSKPPQKQQKTTAARSGFVYILPPTPELWTSSLPHRTQVVYTPDYSYVLQRIQARPGSRLIEAGSGSGSFTHASARAVCDGETGFHDSTRPTGKVFSFEFHEQRFEKMRKEISEHGLSRLVEINHRDVYKDGFLVDGKSPEADAVFLDLPAPWLALPHLSRRRIKTVSEIEGIQTGVEGKVEDEEKWISPLNPKKSAYLCTFSPCIEQVTRTVSEMRKLGWVEIDMVEIAHKRINVFREKIGLDVVSDRGAQQAPGNVAEALAKLKEIEVKTAEHNAKMFASSSKSKKTDDDDDMDDYVPPPQKIPAEGDAEEPKGAEKDAKEAAVKPFLQGRLVTRPEPETKAHTSYLVFAVLPREWTEEDEAAVAARWPVGEEPPKTIGAVDRASRKAQKREMMQGGRKKNDKAKNSHVQRLDLTTEKAKAQAQEIEAEKIVEDAELEKVNAEEA
ncbi:tRNA (adenine-N(1)-)-methyltransferase catalytic subunit trm61 [Diaporthe australafricana]|uniref:tRNA (adenine(58)-N(1))-methyltransferase catalytic subunit TRM61 n=1 Tax=Diaporthe australafricana TaxID=127596 RepID=A0ABR3W7E6_9PEZI